MKRLVSAFVVVVSVVTATAAMAVSYEAGPVAQKICAKGSFSTWKADSRGRLKAVCVDNRPVAYGASYGAGMAYVPRCPKGLEALRAYIPDVRRDVATNGGLHGKIRGAAECKKK